MVYEQICILYPLGKELNHWDRVTYICVSKLTAIGSENGLSPGRLQAYIWTNTGILLIGHLGALHWNFSRHSYAFIEENAPENVVCEMATILSRPQCVRAGKFNFFQGTSKGCLKKTLNGRRFQMHWYLLYRLLSCSNDIWTSMKHFDVGTGAPIILCKIARELKTILRLRNSSLAVGESSLAAVCLVMATA